MSVRHPSGDVAALIALLTEDVRLAMPPLPLEYTGRDIAGRFHATVTFRESGRYRVVPTSANCQPAFGMYVLGTGEANGLMVLTLAVDGIAGMTRFANHFLPRFGLPLRLPAA